MRVIAAGLTLGFTLLLLMGSTARTVVERDIVEPAPALLDPLWIEEPGDEDDLARLQDIDALAQTVWGEARGCDPEEQRLVVWCILQRTDDPRWPDTILDVITQANQFCGYHTDNPIDPSHWALCAAELTRWMQGDPPPTLEPYASTAPYFFFDGDGKHNYYRELYK